MGKQVKRLLFKASYRNFILKHTCFFILNTGGIGGYWFMIIFPSVYVISKSIPVRPQGIFALVIPLGFIIFGGIASIGLKQYGQEIIRLLSGNFLVKTGRVVEKSRNIYTIGPVLSKKKQTKFEHLSYPKFYIKEKNCEKSFQIGDYIKIVYPCSPRLNVRTTHQLYAIYAFSSDETYSMNTQKGTDKERKKTRYLFLTVVIMISVSLQYVIFKSTYMLLKLIHIYP